jgi:hypothetical protein
MNKDILKEFELFKLELSKNDTICTDNDRNRVYRRAISELRREGIIYIPVDKRFYKRIELCTKEEQDKYIRKQLSSWKTQYFNSIVPIKNYMTDEHLKILHEGGLF